MSQDRRWSAPRMNHLRTRWPNWSWFRGAGRRRRAVCELVDKPYPGPLATGHLQAHDAEGD